MLNAPQLRRSARLRDLLFFIGRKTIRDNVVDLKEQEIGVSVFERPPDYDTGQDNIVRVNVSELRKRIDSYFQDRGADEPFRFEIPRGSYLLEFRTGPGASENVTAHVKHSLSPLRHIDEPEPPLLAPALPSASEEMGPKSPSRGASLWITALAVFSLSLLLWAGWLWHRTAELQAKLEPWKSQPNLRAFWSPILRTERPLYIVLGDTSLSLAENVREQAVSLNEYLNFSYDHYASEPNVSDEQKRMLSLILSRNNGSFSDFRVARRILSITPASENIFVRSPREFSPELLKSGEVILVGSRLSDPWVDYFTPALDFRIGLDYSKSITYVENARPGSGEQSRYEVPSGPITNLGYSVVALLPSPHGGDDLLLIAGTDSQATEAAGEFVTSEASLTELSKRLGNRGFPRFQVLLRTSKLRGTPLTAQIVAVHLSEK